MSLILATLNKVVPSGHIETSGILNKMNLPDFVKQDIVGRIKPYLEAIEMDGCSKTKIRKVIVLGNKGIFKHIDSLSIFRLDSRYLFNVARFCLCFLSFKLILRRRKNKFLCVFAKEKGGVCQKSSFF